MLGNPYSTFTPKFCKNMTMAHVHQTRFGKTWKVPSSLNLSKIMTTWKQNYLNEAFHTKKQCDAYLHKQQFPKLAEVILQVVFCTLPRETQHNQVGALVLLVCQSLQFSCWVFSKAILTLSFILVCCKTAIILINWKWIFTQYWCDASIV